MDANPRELFKDLNDDVHKILEMLDIDKDNQFLRRTAVKTSFSYIECVPYVMKYYLRRRLHRIMYELNDKEKTLLYEFDDYKISLLDNFKKTFKLAKKMLLKDNFDLKTSGNEFKSLQKSIHVRDRITHPKKHRDIIISSEEIYNLLVAVEYVENIFIEFLKFKAKDKIIIEKVSE
jgi:hypothetical protein